MRAFQVHVNGRQLCIAGLGKHGVLTVIIDYLSGREGRDKMALSVGGLISSTQEHVHWAERMKLATGDEIKVEIIEVESADSPRKRYRRDPAAEVKQQEDYVREMAKKFGWTVTTGRSRQRRGRE
jgi:hypothetical protein